MNPSLALRFARSFLLDGAVVWLAWQATYLFRLGFDRWLSARAPYDPWVSLVIVAAYGLAAWGLGAHRALWRSTGMAEIRRVALACCIAGLCCGVLIAGVLGLAKIPRAVLVIHPFFVLFGWSLMRLMARTFEEQRLTRRLGAVGQQRTALVIGAGEAARRLLAGIQGQGWRVLGLLDDDARKWGASLSGVPILGSCERMAEMAVGLGVRHLILAIPSLAADRRRELIDLAAATRLPLLTVPSAEELRSGRAPGSLRDVEPEDLLGRDPVALDTRVVRQAVQGSCVAITGAGGSIGSELCLQIAQHTPSCLLLIDHSEYALYRIESLLGERFPDLRIVARLGDVKDESALVVLFQQHRPSLVLHAAAYKHVPLVEQGNEAAAVANNVLGTWRCARAAALARAERFVLISTDKAVNPTNTMGASKRAAEQALVALASDCPSTAFVAVRFGNVLGSSGSVIPKFKEQLAHGGPLTVTHPDVIRYFMTIPEACRLVLQAGAMGDSAQVMVLDMGQPVRIADLAQTMIRLSGYRPGEVDIVYTGLRPGEKLYEELLAAEETTVSTAIPQLRIAKLASAWSFTDMGQWIEQCEHLVRPDRSHPREALLNHLQSLVPEFQPPR